MDRHEKLLIIGAGIGQVPLLGKAHEKGIHVTVATVPGKYPCIPLADDVIYRDIYDRDGVADEAEKRGITAVISDQNDLMNPTVAYVAEKLGLPGNRFDTVMSYCNKNQFRNICEKAGVPVPRHTEVTSCDFDIADIDFSLPWMVKPADSQSSIGVRRIDRKEEFAPAVRQALSRSPTGSAIAEEFFEGQEIVCEGYIHCGKYYNLSFGDRTYFELPDVLIPNQTLFPSLADREILDKIVQYESQLAAYSKPSFAIVHSEYLVNMKSGEIRIVESALRGGGEYISSDLIPLATGIDINEVLLSEALGRKVDLESVLSRKVRRASAYVCFTLPEGAIAGISGLDRLKSLPFVYRAYVDDIIEGHRTEPMTYKGARKGPILVSGRDRGDLESCIRAVQNTLDIQVEKDDHSISGIIWR